MTGFSAAFVPRQWGGSLVGVGMIRPLTLSCAGNLGWICDAHPGPDSGLPFSYIYLLRETRTLERHQRFKPLRRVQ